MSSKKTGNHDPAVCKRRARIIEKYLAKGYPRLSKGGAAWSETAITKAARELNCKPQTLWNQIKRGTVQVDWKKGDGAVKESARPAPNPPASMTAEEESSLVIRRLRDKAEVQSNRIKDLERQINADSDIREAVFGLAKIPVKKSKWDFSIQRGHKSESTPVLFTSDFQCGEVIKPEEVGGLNSYNSEIFKRRYRRVIEKTISLSFDHMVKPKYSNGIVYLRGGDAISGDIHDDLRETNDLSSVPAVMCVVAEEAAGIEKLADKFGKVTVISGPGNHGRTTHKPRSKAYVNLNYETLIAYMLEREFKNDKRVTFITPQSGEAYFSIYNTRFLMTHGDRIGSRGGQGFIGPVATIARGVHKTRKQYASIGKPVDYMLIGHFHEPMWIPFCCVNGNLAGFSEYARDLRVEPGPPSQELFFVNEDIGITARWQILADKMGKATDDTKERLVTC